ncbi:MAG: DUF721 domain-containing protein [Gammaproteobacteria bacterium]|nr:DUF721 domain-containing protein [Gammaproteobacteria bacterium]
MSADEPRRVGQLLPAELLRRMRDHQCDTDSLQSLWHELAGEWAGRADAIDYADGRLVLRVAAPVWGNRLRHETGNLVSRLRKHESFSGLREIVVKVRPQQAMPDEIREDEIRYHKQRQRKRERLSAGAIEAIKATAEMIDDPEVKRALLDLGNVSESSNND